VTERALVRAAELTRLNGAPSHLIRVVDRVPIPVLLVPVDGGEAVAVGV